MARHMKPTTTFRALVLAILLALAVLVAFSVAGCGEDDAAGPGDVASHSPTGTWTDLPQGGDPVELDPSEFTTDIDNPWWPMAPGSRWVYRETDGKGGVQRVEVTVTEDTRTINGIEARVVHDVVTEDGQLVEDTLDWYAQDAEGNIWYLGEDTKEYENGKVATTEGSWEAGVDGAQAGVIVPADPQPGLTYRQEYLAGEAEDAATVLSLDEKVTVAVRLLRRASS